MVVVCCAPKSLTSSHLFKVVIYCAPKSLAFIKSLGKNKKGLTLKNFWPDILRFLGVKLTLYPCFPPFLKSQKELSVSDPRTCTPIVPTDLHRNGHISDLTLTSPQTNVIIRHSFESFHTITESLWKIIGTKNSFSNLNPRPPVNIWSNIFLMSDPCTRDRSQLWVTTWFPSKTLSIKMTNAY